MLNRYNRYIQHLKVYHNICGYFNLDKLCFAGARYDISDDPNSGQAELMAELERRKKVNILFIWHKHFRLVLKIKTLILQVFSFLYNFFFKMLFI